MDISVQVWKSTPHGDAWVTREGLALFEANPLNTLTKGLKAWTYWLKFEGSTTEMRLVNWVGEGQPQVICANSPRGFEVGE